MKKEQSVWLRGTSQHIPCICLCSEQYFCFVMVPESTVNSYSTQQGNCDQKYYSDEKEEEDREKLNQKKKKES